MDPSANQLISSSQPSISPSSNPATKNSLLEKVNSNQFDATINQQQTSPTIAPPLTQDQQLAPNQTIPTFPLSSAPNINPNPTISSIPQSPNFLHPDLLEKSANLSDINNQIAQTNINQAAGIKSITPIEYPGNIPQQTPNLKTAQPYASEITLPTSADLQSAPPLSTPPNNLITEPTTNPPIQSVFSPQLNSLPNFGSPYSSTPQSVIPPLKPVVKEAVVNNNPTPKDAQSSMDASSNNSMSSNINNSNSLNLPLQSTEVPSGVNQQLSMPNIDRYEKKKTTTFILHTIQSLTTASLTFQGLRGLYSSLHFIIVEFPIFEQALNEHQLGEETVNTFAIKAGLMILSTAISLFFAVQLALFKNKTVKVLNIIIGLMITILSVFVMQYAQNIHILDVLPSLL